MNSSPIAATPWTFFSNHTHVLVCLSADGSRRLRDVAIEVGITERAVQRIVADLEAAGVLQRERDPADARRNRYQIDKNVPLRHALESHCQVGELLQLVHAKRSKNQAACKPIATPRSSRR